MISIYFILSNQGINMNEYYSPLNEEKKQIFSEKSLKKMITIWNSFSNHKIPSSSNVSSYRSSTLYKRLDTKMKSIADGQNKYWLWPAIIEKLAEKSLNKDDPKLLKIKRDMYTLAKQELKPEKPQEWYKNPRTWLSNYDIQNVMVQYVKVPKYKYAFLGVFPIDFSVQSSTGVCLYSEFCNIDIQKYAKKCKKFIGFITNLDKHDQPGSHWTSTFIVIDPKLKTYGAYYYDSTGRQMPSLLSNFFDNVKIQCEKLYPDREFRIIQNKKQFQFKNTECGVFSILYQLRWINKHMIKNDQTTFEEIVSGNPYITDDTMAHIRNFLFRPNAKMELKKLKYFSAQKV